MKKIIALAGAPNCGKTTLFNLITKSRGEVGNRPGVTVEKKYGALRRDDRFAVVDLPGAYSLFSERPEERAAALFPLCPLSHAAQSSLFTHFLHRRFSEGRHGFSWSEFIF